MISDDKSRGAPARRAALPPPLRSASHPLARTARLLTRGPKERRTAGLFLVEGPRGLEEAIASAGKLVWVLISEDAVEKLSRDGLVDGAIAAGAPVQPVERALFERLAPSRNGCAALAACPIPERADDPHSVARSASDGLLVVTWGLQDPGNLGTVVRSARAFGAAGLVALGGADPWSPKAVRGSAGAIHTLPVARGEESLDAARSAIQHGKGEVVAAVAAGGKTVEEASLDTCRVMLVGAEVAGLPDVLLGLATGVTIDTGGRVESLSAPVAASVLLYECARAAR